VYCDSETFSQVQWPRPNVPNLTPAATVINFRKFLTLAKKILEVLKFSPFQRKFNKAVLKRIIKNSSCIRSCFDFTFFQIFNLWKEFTLFKKILQDLLWYPLLTKLGSAFLTFPENAELDLLIPMQYWQYLFQPHDKTFRSK
jgi:hypothetical protein